MGLRINTNVVSIKAQRNLQSSSAALNRALERLASGSRINTAGDDAAGLAVSEGLRSQVRGLQQAVRNANEGVGFLTTAEGALGQSTDIAQRIRELAIQAANGTLSDTDRTNLNNEVQQLIAQFDQIATTTEFNGVFLLDGSFAQTDLQVGTRKGQTLSFNIGNARASTLGNVATVSGRQHYLGLSALTGLQVSGQTISLLSTSDTVSSSGKSYSAIALAAAINAVQGATGVAASALTNTMQLNDLQFSDFSGTLATGVFQINGTSIVGSSITSIGALVTAINNQSNATGVKARLQTGSSSGIELYAADGRNITMALGAAVSTSDFYGVLDASTNMQVSTNLATSLAGFSLAWTLGFLSTGVTLSAGTTRIATGAIKLTSATAFTATSGATTSMVFGFAGTTSGASSTAVAIDTSIALSTVALTSQNAATDSLAVIDVVIRSLVNKRAELGAIQNRLASVVSNLGATTENLSAAQSQIRDADIAVETAELTKAQILQQAGIAVLGQANTSASAALQLLKGL